MSRELDQVLALAGPLAESMGFEILKAELTSSHGESVLRIYLENPSRESGTSLEDCEHFSRTLGPILDVEGDLPGRYHLEISSPGLNRPLQTPKHFSAQIGKIIEVTTEDAIEGRRHFKGELKRIEEAGETLVEMEVDGKTFRLPLVAIKNANLDYFATEELLKSRRSKPPKN